jgi:hypothetical protein
MIMLKQFLFIFLLLLSLKSYSQVKKDKINAIGISIPVIWNNSEGTFYSLGNRREPTGKGTSYGININHSRTIYKKLFGVAGIGYFKQAFGISRPFEFNDRRDLLFYTKFYKYDNIQLLAGLGFGKNIKSNFSITGTLIYNQFYSFRQKYTPTHLSNASTKSIRINHRLMSIGSIINMSAGFEKNISKKISIRLNAQLPLLTHWNDDEIFFKLGYSKDEQQIGRNKSSIGTQISCNYNF